MPIYPMNTVLPAHVPAELVYDYDLYQPGPAGSDFFAELYRLKNQVPPVFWTRYNEGHWIVTDSRLAREVLTNSEIFSSRNYVVPKQATPPQAFIPVNLDPPEHGKYRALLSAALSPKMIHSIADDVRALAAKLIDDLYPRGRCEFMSEFAFQLPIIVFMQLVDLPESDRCRLVDEVAEILKPGSDKNRLIGKLSQYLLPIVHQRYESPGADLISRLGRGEIDGKRISIDSLVNMSTLLVIGGLDSMANTLGFFAGFLADSPSHRKQIRANPAMNSRVVDELLRRFPTTTAGLGRYCRQDTCLGSAQIKAGEIVMTPPTMINYDSENYPEPLRVDFSRKTPGMATFGQGRHFCAGANLARMELTIFLEEWLARIPDFQRSSSSTFQPGFNIAYDKLDLVWAV